MAATSRNRQIQVNQVVFDQVDVFQSDFFNRITGLVPADVTLQVFLNNAPVSWPLVDGSGVTDGQVAAGSIYWTELSGGPYSIRFFPNVLGHWNLIFSYAPGPGQVINLGFDVINLPTTTDTGAQVSFTC